MQKEKLKEFDQESLLSEIKSCFDIEELDQLSKESKFVRRTTAKLTGLPFLMMNVFDTTDGKERSLNDSCDWLEEHFDISISKQSLDERYNTYSVDFIKLCFSRVLQIVNEGLVGRAIATGFSKIQLTDATSFRIPDSLAESYKGWEGQGGAAILKMHLNYDFLTGGIEDIFLTDGASNDNKYKLGSKEIIIANALYVRDLGYYDLQHFIKLDKAGAYFLSRAKTNCTYSVKDEKGEFQKVDISDYLPEVGQTKEVAEIYLGNKKKKAKVRLILEAVPEQVAQQRLEKLDRYASKHPKANISEQRKSMCYFNVFITNAPVDMLPTSLVRMVYTIRWQIELIFKIWKSIFDIDKVKKMSVSRFECYIYSKLIAILLTLHIHNKLGQFLWDEEEFELSPLKTAKLVKKKFLGLMEALLVSKQRLTKWFNQTANLLIKRARKQVRKLKGKPPKPTPWEIIKLLT